MNILRDFFFQDSTKKFFKPLGGRGYFEFIFLLFYVLLQEQEHFIDSFKPPKRTFIFLKNNFTRIDMNILKNFS